METEEFVLSLSLLPVTVRFTFLLFSLLFTLTPAAGQLQVIGSLQPVVAVPGDDVILPCHVEPQINVADLTVEWSKFDHMPDPNNRRTRANHVHLYRDNREVPDMKIPSYIGRTALFSDGLRRGDVSLKITNVTHEDEGRYRCFIPKLKSQIQSSLIYLVVDQDLYKSAFTEVPLQAQDLQTPEPSEESDLKGALSHRSRLVPLVIFCSSVSFVAGLGGYFVFVSKCQSKEPMNDAPA